MKNKLIFIVILLFISCKKDDKHVMKDATRTPEYDKPYHSLRNEPSTNKVKEHTSGILYINRYEITEGDMKFILYRESDGGLVALNITKDSLEVELLKHKLNEK